MVVACVFTPGFDDRSPDPSSDGQTPMGSWSSCHQVACSRCYTSASPRGSSSRHCSSLGVDCLEAGETTLQALQLGSRPLWCGISYSPWPLGKANSFIFMVFMRILEAFCKSLGRVGWWISSSMARVGNGENVLLPISPVIMSHPPIGLSVPESTSM